MLLKQLQLRSKGAVVWLANRLYLDGVGQPGEMQGTVVYDGACGKEPLIIDPRIRDWFGLEGT